MKQGYIANNRSNESGAPTGGSVVGTGFTIVWQDGPLGRDGDRVQPNGAFIEDVIGACSERLEYFQNSRFACPENEKAVMHLHAALTALEDRTRNREVRKVEGTHSV
jgi:hypothetical protein